MFSAKVIQQKKEEFRKKKEGKFDETESKPGTEDGSKGILK